MTLELEAKVRKIQVGVDSLEVYLNLDLPPEVLVKGALIAIAEVGVEVDSLRDILSCPHVATEGLLDCPFCNSNDVDAEGWMSNDGDTGPACNNCNATADTVELWNNRC